MRYWLLKLCLVIVLSAFVLGGCRVAPIESTALPTTERPSFPADTATFTATVVPMLTATQTVQPSDTPQPTNTETQPPYFPDATDTPTLSPTATTPPPVTYTPVITETMAVMPTETQTPEVYPPPIPTSTSIYSDYPPPIATSTSIYWDYPQPAATSTQYSQASPAPTTPGTQTGGQVLPTALPTVTSTRPPTPTRPVITGPTVTDYVGRPLGTPEGVGSVVTLWHGLNGRPAEALNQIIKSFRDAYPDVSFIITYVPQDELRSRYEAASYYGKGPSLVMGPAIWGWAYAQSGLVVDLSDYASPEFLGTLNPAAVDTLRIGKQLIGLPYAQQGYVLYRNTSFLPKPANTFDELVASAKSATRGGRVGAYLEREAILSSAGLIGLGGQLMDGQGLPAFNDANGLAWFDLLTRYEEAGLAGMHTNRDLDLFKLGKIGYIIEGTWRLNQVVTALGAQNVAIDPWPAVGTGSMSGFVQTDAIFLNTNVEQKNRLAALRFMGYLMTNEAQTLLGESGCIPTVLKAEPRSIHVQQAMAALQTGVAWPLAAEEHLAIYWNALDEAINNVYVRGDSPADALQAAHDIIISRLDTLGKGE